MSTETKPLRWDPFSTFLVIACLALAVLVLLLARENRALKASLASGGHTSIANDPNALKAGDTMAPFDMIDASGAKTRLEFGRGEDRTLLLVFSVSCPACEKNLPIWNALLVQAPPPSVRVVAIQTDKWSPTGEKSAALDPTFPYPVYGIGRAQPAPLAKVPYIPATVVLDRTGVVIKAWFGILTADQQLELRKEIGIAAG